MACYFLEHSHEQQHIRASSVNHIITALHDIKYIVGTAGVLVAFLFDKSLGPADDDLPLRFKILLVAPLIVSTFLFSLTD
jgi:hypothetical protein